MIMLTGSSARIFNPMHFTGNIFDINVKKTKNKPDHNPTKEARVPLSRQ